MKKRMVLLCVFALMAMASLSAQGGNEGQTVASKSNERVKLTFLTSVNVDTEGYDVNESPYLKYIEEKFNVDIEIISEASKYYNEKLNATMASGNLPDYFNITQKKDLLRWASEGMTLPLDNYLKACPALQSQVSDLAWDLCRYEDGKIYGVPLLRYDATPMMTFVRKDWMDKLGIKPEDVKTTEDWYNMLYKFVHNDPDGNGKDDTEGMLSSSNRYSAVYRTFLEAFNGATSQIINGKVVPYYLTPGFKDYLKFMQRLYKDGLINSKYLVTTQQQLWDDITKGKGGCFLYFWMTTELRSKGFDTTNLYALNPPLKADGSKSFYIYGSPVRTYTAISKNCKHPEKVLEILNWACTEEGGIYVFGGLEGLDWTKDENGKITIKPDRRGKNTSLRFILLGAQKPKIDTPVLQDLMAQAWGENGLEFLNKANVSGGYDELEMKAPYFPELSMYDDTSNSNPVFEFWDLAIMGKVDIDKEWDGYVKKIMDSGASEKIRLMTDWYSKTNKK